MKYFIPKIICFLIIIGISSTSFSQDENYVANVQNLLMKIEKYEYNQDGTPLYQLDSLITKALNENSNLGFLEEKLIESLKSNSTHDAKLFICKKLATIGTEKSVEPLITLIDKAEYSNIVRIPLEKIKSDKVDSELINNLDKVDDKVKEGIIVSLGVRKSLLSIDAIAKFVLSDNIELAKISALALGHIRGTETSKTISSLLDKVCGDVREALFDSYLLCADEFLLAKNNDQARSIYSNVYESCETPSIKSASLNGLIKSSPDNRGSIIINSLKSNNTDLIEVAISQLESLKSSEEFETISESFNSFDQEIQERLLYRISELELNYFIDDVRSALKDGNKFVKIAAANCLINIGNKNDIPQLTSLALENDYELNSAGKYALYNIKGKNVDENIITSIDKVDIKSKIELVKAIGERRIITGFNTLLQTARSENIHLRLASYESLGIISTPNQIDELVNLFLKIENVSELKKIENTLAKTALKNESVNERSKVYLASLDKINDFNKEKSLVRIIGSTGDKNGYAKIKEYIGSDNDEMQKVAILSLYNWTNLDPLEDLKNQITDPNNETNKILALRGYINLIKSHQLKYEGNIIEKYKSILEYVEEDSEKRMILSALSELRSLESVDIAMMYLNEDRVKEEAEIALLVILNRVRWENPNEAYDALEKVIEDPTSEDVSIEAKRLLKKIVRN